MHLKFIKIGYIVLLAILFIGCGGSSSNSPDEEATETTVVEQLVDYSCNESQNSPIILEAKSGFDGDIGYDCAEHEYTMENGITQLEIANIEAIYLLENSTDAYTKQTTNIENGTSTVFMSHPNFDDISCTTTFDNELPLTIYSTDMGYIKELLETMYPIDATEQNTTCDGDPSLWNIDGVPSDTTTRREITITDTSGTKHNISTYDYVAF